MDLINEQVESKKYGKGTIIEQDEEGRIIVRFEDGDTIKTFGRNSIADGLLMVRAEIFALAQEEARIIAEREAEERRQKQAQQNDETHRARTHQRQQPVDTRVAGEETNSGKYITVGRMRQLIGGRTDSELKIYLSEIEVAIGGKLCESYVHPESFTIQRVTPEPFDRICRVYGYVPIRVCYANGVTVERDEIINLDRPADYYVVLQRL